MRILLFIPVLLIGFTTSPAISGEVEACGVPVPYNLPTETKGFCDIYQRQIAYREEAIKLDEQLKERQENYAAPRRQAYGQYLKDLKNVDKTRGTIVPEQPLEENEELEEEKSE